MKEKLKKDIKHGEEGHVHSEGCVGDWAKTRNSTMMSFKEVPEIEFQSGMDYMINELDRECQVLKPSLRTKDPTPVETLNDVGSFLVKGGQCLKDLGYEFLLLAEIEDNYHDAVSDIFAALAIGMDYEAAKRECGIEID